MNDTKPDPNADGTPTPEAEAEIDVAADAPETDDPTVAEDDAAADAVDEAVDELTSLKDQLLRAMAETENVRNRAKREREDATKFAIANFARDMASVADDLGRALASVPEDAATDEGALHALIQGVEMTRRNLDSTLDRHGLTRIDPLGEKFDHNFHEAMFEVETVKTEPGTVVQVIQQGYRIHDRLLRPARVGIAKRPPGGGLDTEA